MKGRYSARPPSERGRRARLQICAALVAVALAPAAPAQETIDDLFLPDDPAPEAAAETSADSAGSEPASIDDLFGGPAGAETAAEDATEPESVDDLFGGEAPAAMTAAAPTSASSIKVSGFLQNELAYTYVGDEHFQKFKNIALVKLSGRLSPRVKWQASGRLIYDPVFEFETHYPDAVEDDQKLDGWIDETYIDIDADAWEIRLGRQHIIWGEMVGLFFADVVSALDLREFVLPDFDMIRVPQWAARAEYFNGDFHGEFIVLPYVTPDDVGVFGAEYYPFPFQLPPGVQALILEDKEDQNDPIADVGFGTRASYLKDGWDMAVFYYTSPDRTAALRRRIDFGPVPTVTFKPVHERIHQLGGTLAKDLGSFVIKAEAVQTMDRLMSVTRIADTDGLVETDELRYVVGAEWAGGGGHNVNVQFFQTWFQQHDHDMLFDELETGMSILLTSENLHPDFTPEILWIRSLNRNEWLLEAKVSWDFAASWRATLGADIFHGPRTGLLGQFDDTDRVYYELRYSF